jgi:hypothetical protein
MGRWYDQSKFKSIKHSLNALEVLPDEFTAIIANGICHYADRHFEAFELSSNAKTLGFEKVASLYKSKKKLRPYDRHPDLHRAMNYLTILPEDDRLVVGRCMADLCTYSLTYIKLCKATYMIPKAETMVKIVKIYIEEGDHNASQFVQDLIRQNTPEEAPTETIKEAIHVEVTQKTSKLRPEFTRS